MQKSPQHLLLLKFYLYLYVLTMYKMAFTPNNLILYYSMLTTLHKQFCNVSNPILNQKEWTSIVGAWGILFLVIGYYNKYCVLMYMAFMLFFWVLKMLSVHSLSLEHYVFLKPNWCHQYQCESLPENISLNKNIHWFPICLWFWVLASRGY